MSADLTGLDFGAAMRDAQRGLVVKPILHNYLHDARFPNFTIKFDKGDQQREPDGWFHPSEHPLWPERALYTYLHQPAMLAVRARPYMNVLSLTFGTAAHGFITMCLQEARWLAPAPKDDCPVCGDRKKAKCRDWGVIDREVGELGHGDGVSLDGDWFELKTTTELSTKVRQAPDLDLDYFRLNWIDYYAQVQSYLRMSGRQRAILLFLTLGYPWTMKEFHIPLDHAFCRDVREKYLRVRQAKSPPLGCCGEKNCASYPACKVYR